jgi:DNA-binding NtrC family response regulator
MHTALQTEFPRVLVVDDEKNIRTTLQLCLQSMHCAVAATGSAQGALAELERAPLRARTSVVPQLGGAFTLDEIEREHIARIVQSARSQEDAARILGIDASTLWRKRKRSI